LTVRSTEHGPLIHELLGIDEPLSLAWVGAQAKINSGWLSMSQLAGARNAGELLGALATHHEPALAFAYADRRGAGGIQVAGWFPTRVLPADLVPLPGRASWYDWTGHVAFSRLPAKKLRSGRGWVIAADNPLASVGKTKDIEWLWRSGERAGRIDALLGRAVDDGKIDLRKMSLMQSDVGSESALSVITTALEAAGPVESLSVEAREIAQLLMGWDGSSGAESVGASVYYVFIERLSAGLFTQVLGEDLAKRYRALPQVDIIEAMLALIAASESDPDNSAIDTESVRTVMRASLRQTWLELSFRLGASRQKWRWGRLHELSFQPFGNWQTGLSVSGLEDLPYGGGGNTVNTAEFIGPESLEVRVASTFRIVVDVGSPDQALTALAPGQSEHPGHLHYRDGLEGWLGGRSELLVTDSLLVKESGALQLILEPAP
jgi:acyl-homoserine lactone acylase PvdQ